MITTPTPTGMINMERLRAPPLSCKGHLTRSKLNMVSVPATPFDSHSEQKKYHHSVLTTQ